MPRRVGTDISGSAGCTRPSVSTSCGCTPAVFALVASVLGAEKLLVVPQHSGLVARDAVLASACGRQHGFAEQNPAAAASGNNPLSKNTTTAAKRRRITGTNGY